MLLVALAALGAARSVAAAPAKHVELAWSQEDPSCIDGLALAASVESTLGRAVFHAATPATAKVSGVVRRRGRDRFEARIALIDAEGAVVSERTVATSGDCRRLDEAVAVVVTLMIDGIEETPSPLQVPAEPPRPPPPAAPAMPAAPIVPHEPPRPPPKPLALTLGVGAGLSSSFLPGLAASFDVRSEVAPPGFVPIALSLRVSAPSSALAAGAGGNFHAVTAELAACPAWAPGRVRLGGCAGLGGGAVSGSYVGLVDGANPDAPIVYATLLPFVGVRLAGPLWARAEAGARFTLLRQRWGFLDARGAFEQVYRPAIVAPSAALTLELRVGS